MSALVIYIAGLLTPFAVWIAGCSWFMFEDWRRHRRYERAWKKFTAEWHALPLSKQADFLANPPHQSNMQHPDGQSAWFVYRWNGGYTTEA